jgi:hypothetical protein
MQRLYWCIGNALVFNGKAARAASAQIPGLARRRYFWRGFDASVEFVTPRLPDSRRRTRRALYVLAP